MLSFEYKPSVANSLKIAKRTAHLMCLQARSGVEFDSEAALKLLEKIDARMLEIEAIVEPQLPRKPITESSLKMPPVKQFKQNGQPTKHTENYFPNLRQEEDGHWVFDHPDLGIQPLPWKLPIVTHEIMRISNQDAIKNWLMDQGWEPLFWNTKKEEVLNERTGKTRMVNVQTSPKIQEQGTICPNLLLMEGELAGKIKEWLSLRNRRSVICSVGEKKDTGWLKDKRLGLDGRLSAGFSGPAQTWRMKHRNVVNVPKADPKVLLGKEMRSLFKVRQGRILVGADAAGLEARIMSHYTYRYDQGAFGKILLELDWHSFNAVNMFPNETRGFDISDPNFDKEDIRFKPWRSKAKNAAYA